MAKNKNDYFKLIEEQVAFSLSASDLLLQILNDYSSSRLSEYREKMHKIENDADELHHDILKRLSSEFITPIDQEDILRLVQIIDDITDALDETVLDFYMYRMDRVPSGACELAGSVSRCVKALLEASKELKNFKKPEKLRALLTEVNSVESSADGVYTEAIHSLFANEDHIKMLIGGKELLESLENCCDLCEHASDVIEQIIIKNT